MRVMTTALICLAAASPALAECSRPITVAVTPTSHSSAAQSGKTAKNVLGEVMAALAKTTGCEFVNIEAPRARAVLSFENGEAYDILPNATETPTRDAAGIYVLLATTSVSLIALKDKDEASLLQRLAAGKLRINVVRGFVYGPAYLKLSEKLEQQGALERTKDATAIMKKIKAGRADGTIGAPFEYYAAARAEKISDRLAIIPLKALDRISGGMYLSRTRLNTEDQETLVKGLEKILATGELKSILQRNYPEHFLTGMVTAVPSPSKSSKE